MSVKKPNVDIVLETLARINRSLDSDANALISCKGSTACHPEAAYIELVRDLISLLD